MNLTKDIFDAVVAGDQAVTDGLVKQALEAGIPAQTVLGEGLIAPCPKSAPGSHVVSTSYRICWSARGL
jgi:methanogenic corrinoid protein MtbC1